uniref:Reverse transcriptase Ty1/copia-type domain-containing protein n=1 Tax=Tanacetum cinerariifolium TaxID=118510 RepID=A0A699GTT0_TANCI|nr:hypothetical protein [Tanacetum cinerariifolium]
MRDDLRKNKEDDDKLCCYYSDNSINKVNAAGTLVLTIGQISPNNTNTFSVAGPSNAVASPTHGKSSFIDAFQLFDDPDIPKLKDITYSDDEDDVGAEADFNNFETSITVSPIPTTRVHKDHPVTQIIGDLSLATQTRSMTRRNPRGYNNLLKIQVGLKLCKKSFFNSRCRRNKARLVAQVHTQEEGIDYKEVFAPVARIEVIRLFLAYASFMGFMVYQMNVKSAFLYGTIEEKVYVCQPLGFEDPDHLDKVYKVVKALYGLHQAPRAWYETLANYLLENDFQRGKIDQTLFIKRQKGLQVKKRKDGIFIRQDKYVTEILRKFGLTKGKLASTPIDTEKPLLKDLDGEDVDMHTYRLMIGSLMYLTSSRPDIMFVTTVTVKKVNDVIRLQALVDKKKVVVTEATIREALCLDDEKGVECLPNEEIFVELARMGYEKPSTKLTFYKAFVSSDLSTHTIKYTSPALTQKVFTNMRRVGKGFFGVETPLFEGMLVAQEVVVEGDDEVRGERVNAGDVAKGDVSAAHGEVQPTPPQSPQVQPPSPLPLQQQDARIPMNLLQEVMDTCIALTRRVEHLEFDKVAQALEITKLKRRVKKLERRNKVTVLKLRRLQKVGTLQRVETSNETMMDDVSNQERMIDEMDQNANVVLEDDKEVADAVKDVHVEEIVTAASETITAASTNITAAKAQVSVATTFVTLTAAPTRVTVAPSRRRKGVVVRDLQKESTTSTIIPAETKSKDKGKGILVEEPKPLKKQAQIKQDEKYARKLEAELNRNIDWYEAIDHMKNKAKEDPAVKRYQIDYFKGMSYDDIRPIFEAKFNTNVAFLQKTKEQIKKEESRAQKRLNKTPTEKATKRQKLDEERGLGGFMEYTCSNLEESKKYTWSSKGQGMEAIGIMWCADHNIYNHPANFVSREEVPTHKIHSKPDGECSLELMLLKEFKKKHAKCLMMLVKDLVLPSQVDAVD